MSRPLAQLLSDVEGVSDRGERIARYRALAEATPAETVLWLNLGSELVQAGEVEDARATLERAISLVPSLADRLPSHLRELLEAASDSPRSAAAGRIGARIDRFKVTAVTAQAATQVLLEAVSDDGDEVTLRLLPDRSPAVVRAQFELERAAAVDLPAFARIRELVNDEDGFPVQVLDRVRGRTIADRFDAGAPLDLGAALSITHAISVALEPLHATGRGHGALGPDFVVCDGDAGSPIVTLLGASPAREGGAGRTLQLSPDLLGWLAPESLGAATSSPRADVYTLGLLLHFMITRTPPAHARRTGHTVRRVSQLEQELPGNRHMSAALYEIDAILESCLCVDARHRMPSAAELSAALSDIHLESRSILRSTPEGPPRSTSSGDGPRPPEFTTPALPPPGAVIDKWRLAGAIGEGEFGAVFEAEHTLIDGHRAALKILHPHKALDPQNVRRFINEASAASCANHENIIQVFDAEARPGALCYLAMELLRGSLLRDCLRAGPIDARRTIRIGAQIAEALDAAHRIGVVHRDLKPDNVFLVERSGNPDFVKLFDFGIARLRDTVEGGGGRGPRTRSGVVMGTPEYMSPEQWMAAPTIDARTDIYALGMLLYECLTGHAPFTGNLYTCMQDHVQKPVPHLPDVGPQTKALDELIQAMTAKERDNRPHSAREVVLALEAAEGHQPASPARSRPFRSAGARPKSRVNNLRGAWVIAGGLFVLAAAIAAIAAPGPRAKRAATANKHDAAAAPTNGPKGADVTTRVSDPPALPPAVPAAEPPATTTAVEQGPSTVAPNIALSGRPTRYTTSYSPKLEGLQRAAIEGCIGLARLPGTFEIVLERSGTLHVTRGPQPDTLRRCLREAFRDLPPPERVVVRRRAVTD